jgi:hypothetical protein
MGGMDVKTVRGKGPFEILPVLRREDPGHIRVKAYQFDWDVMESRLMEIPEKDFHSVSDLIGYAQPCRYFSGPSLVLVNINTKFNNVFIQVPRSAL